MLLLDVNVVLAASRSDHPAHAQVRLWFDDMLTREERFTVPTVVWGSFLRLATNRRVFVVPTPLSEALYSYEGTREINTLIVGRAVTGQGAFV